MLARAASDAPGKIVAFASTRRIGEGIVEGGPASARPSSGKRGRGPLRSSFLRVAEAIREVLQRRGVIGDGDHESRAESELLRSARNDPGDSVSRGPAQALSNKLQETVMAAFHFWNFRTYVEQTMSESGSCDSSEELVSDLLMGLRSRRSLRRGRSKPIASMTSVADGGVVADYTFVFLAGRPRLTGATATAFWRGAAFSRS
jgi:hypothetical protein